MTTELVVLESPFAGNVARDLLFARWCCRALTLRGAVVWASHIYGTQYLRDGVATERETGMNLTDRLTDDRWAHWHAQDFGNSPGMLWAINRYRARQHTSFFLEQYCPDSWVAFKRGEDPVTGLVVLWPPEDPALTQHDPEPFI